MSRVSVIGAGAWGTALASVARRNRHTTILWARDPELAESINATGRNERYIPDIALPSGILATSEMEPAIADSDAVLLAVPAQHLRSVAQTMREYCAEGTPVAICAKGIELSTQMLMSEVLHETLPGARQAVLSGPTFAQEVARNLPAAVTVAAREASVAEQFIAVLGAATFRPYASSDPVGAEIGGAVKNVLAIACGIVSGRQLGDNARAALITRGLAEIVRLGVAKGARPETLMGLSGLGDLTLTCNAMQSRNFSLGVALGQGDSLDTVLSGRRMVTEGVFSAGSVTALAGQLGVELPICEAVNQIVNHKADLSKTITDLLNRPFAREDSDSD